MDRFLLPESPMDSEEFEEGLGECANCGAIIAEGTDPGFPFGENSMLCFECAIRRGGEYDSSEDRWVVLPSVSDLEEQEQHHPEL